MAMRKKKKPVEKAKPAGKTKASEKKVKKGARRAAAEPPRPIDARLKTMALAAEPPSNRDPAKLVPEFAAKLQATLNALDVAGIPFKFVEGFRTVERQQWLYGSGRPNVTPYGRPGPIVTQRDGVTRLSNHQGDGTPGSGRAADCYPMKNGKVYIPAANDPVWKTYADAAKANGLDAGYYWTTFKDAPHIELLENA